MTAAPARASTPRPSHPSNPTSNPTSTSSAAPAVSSAAAGRRQSRQSSVDPLSDRGTTLLIRRTLCPQQLGDKARDVQTPIEELLPPLTSSNDVDLQLYAFLAIILREFVQTWYGRITTDETFVAEIVHIIAHCTRALEQRCRTLDLESLLLDEIPDLLDRHITAYRTAHQPVSQPPVQVDPREIYHSLCPLPPLSPVPRPGHSASAAEQEANEKDYRQLLVQGVLALLLPTEDLENPCLTSLVGQILSELIIGNVIANKASQPWLLFEAICILGRLGTTRKEKKSQDGAGPSAGPSSNPKVTTKPRPKWSVQGLFVSVIQFGILAFASIRFVIVALVMSSSVPSRFSFADEKGGVADHHATEPKQPVVIRDKAPVLAFGVWSCISNLIELHLRMPWLNGFLSLLQAGAIYGPGTMAGLDSPLDRLLSYHIRSILSPSRLPPLLRTLRGVLFPNNAPGTSSLFPPSSEAELHALRRRAASALWGLLPTQVGRLYFGGRLWRREDPGDEAMVDEVEGLLMVLSDEYCNKHLMYGILELILVRLMPELSEKSVVELWDERLG